jgi:uncharacterized protein (TIGR02147 family)
MKSDIYEYRDYKKYVIDLIRSDAPGTRGKRKELSEFIGCQVSHISNVLSGSGHFNPEQAEAASRFFGLSSQEIEFFLMLIQYNRAGTESLKKFYSQLLQERQKKSLLLKNRLEMPDSLQHEDEAIYYSSWHYAAIHVLLSIKQFQTREAIAKKLDVPLPRVDQVLEFLAKTGLCRKEGVRNLIVKPLLHLDKSSPLISKHHTNWRLKTMMALDQNNDENLHYSSVFTVSKKDFPRVREIVAEALTKALKVINPSPEEEVAAICIDLFKI